MRKLLLSAGMVALLATGGLPAQGHSQLITAYPRPGSTIVSAPEKVVLEFNENLINIGGASNVLSVKNSIGQTVSTGVTAVDGAKVSIALSKKLPVGKYTVRWRIVSADGHPLAGRYSFTIRKKR